MKGARTCRVYYNGHLNRVNFTKRSLIVQIHCFKFYFIFIEEAD